jgi:hypothetical protein
MAVDERPDCTPDACTLPMGRRPLRVMEFDELFASVLRKTRAQPTRLDLVVPPDVEAAAHSLAERESACCSFFTFEFEPAGGNVVMHIIVPPDQVAALDAIASRVRPT